MRTLRLAWLSLPAIVACGGSVAIFDSDDGDGGAPSAGGSSGDGGAAVTTTGGTTSGSTGAGGAPGTGGDPSTGGSGGVISCSAGLSEYVELLEMAVTCNACQDFDGCWDGPELIDTCGCPLVANIQHGETIDQAKALWDKLVESNCAPLECGQPCKVSDDWGCMPNANGTCDGSCQPI